VPNRRAGQKKVQAGKFLENIKRAGRNKRAGGKFSGKSINVRYFKAYFDISIELFITNLDFLTKLQVVFNLDATHINVQGEFFLKINKRADQNKTV
jgi:hypothetical protein